MVGIRTKVCPFCQHKFEPKNEKDPKIIRTGKERRVIKKLDIPSNKDIISPKGVDIQEIAPKGHALMHSLQPLHFSSIIRIPILHPFTLFLPAEVLKLNPLPVRQLNLPEPAPAAGVAA